MAEVHDRLRAYIASLDLDPRQRAEVRSKFGELAEILADPALTEQEATRRMEAVIANLSNRASRRVY